MPNGVASGDGPFSGGPPRIRASIGGSSIHIVLYCGDLKINAMYVFLVQNNMEFYKHCTFELVRYAATAK